jgi:hypothetical protein
MSGYTSGNNAPTLMAQAPNRKGNVSKDPAKHSGGATNVVGNRVDKMTPAGSQGAPKVGGEVTCGRYQKVALSTPAPYSTKSTNTGYVKGSSYLK